MTDLTAIEAEINALTKQGQILEAIEKHYAPECTFTEMDGSARGSKAEQLTFLEGFFGSLTSFDGAALHGEATGSDFSSSEWTFNMTAGDGSKIEWNEMLVRDWKDGKVVAERYYQR